MPSTSKGISWFDCDYKLYGCCYLFLFVALRLKNIFVRFISETMYSLLFVATLHFFFWFEMELHKSAMGRDSGRTLSVATSEKTGGVNEKSLHVVLRQTAFVRLPQEDDEI